MGLIIAICEKCCLIGKPIVGTVLRVLSSLILACTLSLSVAADDFNIESSAYDTVLLGGRVIDPESGLDAIKNVGIADGRIITITDDDIVGKQNIDLSGLVVSPGFIDLHTHSPTPMGQDLQIMDGVTTALELEVGSFPFSDYGKRIEAAAAYNYGSSVSYLFARVFVKNGLLKTHITESPIPQNFSGAYSAFRNYFFGGALEALTENATDKEILEITRLVEEELDNGAIGIGLALDYFNEAAGAKELESVFRLSGRKKAPLFIHMRRGGNGDTQGLIEVLSLAKKYAAPIHLCHITHMSISATAEFLEIIRSYRSSGVDVTVEVLPYNAGSTLISANVYGRRNWRDQYGVEWKNVEWAATGERFNEEKFKEYREKSPDGQVINHYLKDEWTQMALAEPGTIVVSDLMPVESFGRKVAPHNNAFSKVLARYVRETPVLSLMDALSRMTILPAKRLENIAPVFEKKGRVQEGMDADLTVFDPDRILDQATYRDPYQTPIGIEYVFVNGVAVVSAGKLDKSIHPGRRLVANTLQYDQKK